jgi:hypothetical protein
MPDPELHAQRLTAARLSQERRRQRAGESDPRIDEVVNVVIEPLPAPKVVVIEPGQVTVIPNTTEVVIEPGQGRVVEATFRGPLVLLTHRDGTAERSGFPMYSGSSRSLESAIDEAVGRVGRDKKDVIVWSGTRVAAVVNTDDKGGVQVTPFIEPPSEAD